MAAIIELPSAAPASTFYAVIRNGSGQCWNGTGFEVFNGANWSNYINTLSEDRYSGNGSGYYKGIFPSNIPAGKYTEVFYQQSGASPSFGDQNVGSGQIFWNGSVEEQGIGIVTLAQLNAALMPELTGIPSAMPTIYQALMLMYMSLRNKHTATSVQETIYNDAGASITTSVLNDDGNTYTKAKFS